MLQTRTLPLTAGLRLPAFPRRPPAAPKALALFLRAHASRWTGGTLLVLLCLAAYLPGLGALPPVEADEARYLEAARAMLFAPDWRHIAVPRIDGAPRLNKPPLVYWLEAASAYVFSGGHPDRLSYPAALKDSALGRPTITGSPPTRSMPFTGGAWAYRIPSILATIAAVLITWRLGLTMMHPQGAWLAAALLGGCYLVLLDARLARTDQVLLACTCAAQWALWHIWRNPTVQLRWPIFFWIAIGLGTLAKGPVTPGVAALTITALCMVTGETAWMRRLRPIWGATILLVLLAPPAILAVSAVGSEALIQAVAQELLGRGVEATGGRAGPPGYHLVLLHGLFWPGALLVVPGFLYAARRGVRWRRTNESGVRLLRPGKPVELFCLAWVVPSWLVLELIGTKLPHYPLPLYPAIALLCSRAAWAGAAGTLPLVRSRSAAFGDAAWLLVGLSVLIGVPILLAWKGRLRVEPGTVLALVANLVVLATLLVIAWHLVRRRRFVGGLLVSLFGSLLGGRGLFDSVLPNLRAPWANSAIVGELATIDPQGARPLAAAGYFRESLSFLTGGRVEHIPPSMLGAWLDEHADGLVVLGNDGSSLDGSMRVAARVPTFDYVEGGTRVLTIVERASAAR